IDLGTLGGAFSGALGVNNDGVVVGRSTNAAGERRAFRWTSAEGMHDLGSLGGTPTDADAINSRGDIVGSSRPVDGDFHAVLWTRAGSMRDLGTFGGVNAQALGINNLEQITGGRDVGDFFSTAFVWSEKDGFRDIGNLGGTGPTDGAIGNDINERGDVTGNSITAAEEEHAFFWSEAVGMLDLGTLGGGSSGGIAINSARQVGGRTAGGVPAPFGAVERPPGQVVQLVRSIWWRRRAVGKAHSLGRKVRMTRVALFTPAVVAVAACGLIGTLAGIHHRRHRHAR